MENKKMKVTAIQADNLLGIQSVNVKLPTTITLFAGRNGSGKSSIQEAVRIAITQDTVREVNLKKEFGKLVHGEAKAGGAHIGIDNDPDKSFAFNMPKGEFVGPEITEAMRVALYGQRFARMTADERRTFLFGLTKLKPNAETVKARMLAEKWACEESKVDAVLPLLRTGFPSVCDHAKSKATEAKGAWRQLTGGTYGALKAAEWEAPLPDLPEGDLAHLETTVAGLDRNIATLNESLGAIKNAARKAQEDATRRASLAAVAGKVPDLADQLARAKQELADYEPSVVALRERAAGKARVGLVHDMAVLLDEMAKWLQQDEPYGQKCEEMVERYEAENGKMGAKVDTEAQALLPAHEQGLVVIQNRIRNLQRDLDSATQAKGQFDALAPADGAVDASAELAEVEDMLKSARADRQTTANKLLDIQAATNARAAAATKTAQALAHHNDVMAWTKVADALAPDGIPAEMLNDALEPVNAGLAQNAIDTEWMVPAVSSDMALTADGRPYQLLSESEQWRWDAMFAEVVAELSGLRILMLDRFDVLDLPGRAQCLEWLDSLAFNDVMDTILLFGTLKALPTDLADTITAYWVEDGMIAGAREQAAA
jgi:energy-coupling factor transporter ATP-binding protein EcfA2